MKKNYDFSQGKRGPVLPAGKGKTRITIRLDDDLLAWFRDRAERAGEGGYQVAINAALREHISREPWERALRRVLREELRRVG
ncbi:MAG: BrnA antitoxin family protein [Terriglobales bacterium]